MSIEHLKSLLDTAFPIKSDRFELSLVGLVDGPNGDALATLQLVNREEHNGDWRVRDVKEQQVMFLPQRHREHPRLDAYLAGFRAAVQRVFDALYEEKQVDKILCAAMPCDFVHSAVLDLKKAETADDYENALLTAKRLGSFLV